jgi:hypothetical protein
VTRSERLFALIQALRRHRRPVTAQKLATELSVPVDFNSGNAAMDVVLTWNRWASGRS